MNYSKLLRINELTGYLVVIEETLGDISSRRAQLDANESIARGSRHEYQRELAQLLKEGE